MKVDRQFLIKVLKGDICHSFCLMISEKGKDKNKCEFRFEVAG